MKRMMKSDLIMVLNDIPGDADLDIQDLINLFEAFGDDWVLTDGKRIRKTSNEAMAAIRESNEYLP